MSDNALIKVTDLKKHYNGGEVKALDGVNCEIEKGEVVVVIGPSGSGKSTFLRSLNLLEIPTGGQIIFNGADILPTLFQIGYAFSIGYLKIRSSHCHPYRRLTAGILRR